MNSRLNLSRLRAAGLGVAAAFFTIASVHAGAGEKAPSYSESRSAVVSYADIDLATEQGASTLYTRLVSAANSVCGKVESRDLARYADWRNCRGAALDDAVSKVNDVRLTRMHQRKTQSINPDEQQVAGRN